MEREFYSLLTVNAEDTVHWIRQLGLWKDAARGELLKLSRVSRTGGLMDEKSCELQKFKNSCPAIYCTLYSAFGLLPSNGRLIEQRFSSLKSHLDPSQSHEMVDMKEVYLGNLAYLGRAARREAALGRRGAKRLQDGSVKDGGIKHEGDKLLQQMLGQQLHDSMSNYEGLEQVLPTEFLKSIRIRTLKKRGILSKDKERAIALGEYARATEDRRKTPRMTAEEISAEAAATLVDNDIDWVDLDEQERRQSLDELIVKTFWTRQSRETLKGAYKRVFPCIGVAEKSTKGSICTLIGAHLKAVKELSKAEDPSTSLTTLDLLPLAYYDRLAVFVDLEEAKELVEAVQTGATKAFQAGVRALIASNGSNVDPHYFKAAGVEPGVTSIDHGALLEYLGGLEDDLDDDL
jgi:hypothetical protein